MKAAICPAYGPPQIVRIVDIDPPAVGPDMVLVRVRASTVSAGDARVRGARFPSGFGPLARLALGVWGPRRRTLGTEFSGVVDAVGSRVVNWVPGDRVFAMTGARFGGHAELAAVSATSAIARMPAGASFEEAAALAFGGTTALYFLRDVAKLRPGEHLLVNGASGAVGSAAVQLARHLGATVTAVCSAANADVVRSLGASRVIDYHARDFCAESVRYDVILDAVGNASLARCRPVLAERGRLLLAVASLLQLLQAPFQSRRNGIRVAGGTAPERAADLQLLAELREAGKYRPLIDRICPFGAIAEAHARADSGRKVGSVVVTLPGN